jgi:hypothetical protein
MTLAPLCGTSHPSNPPPPYSAALRVGRWHAVGVWPISRPQDRVRVIASNRLGCVNQIEPDVDEQGWLYEILFEESRGEPRLRSIASMNSSGLRLQDSNTKPKSCCA